MSVQIKSIRRFIGQAILDPRHPAWVAIQLLAVRGLVAAKFLFAARLLGPQLVGLVGIALLSLAIVESLSDTGMQQAVVQRRSLIDSREAGAVWTLQVTRGLAISAALFALSWPLTIFFHVPDARGLIALAALLPLIRNAFNPGLFVLQRDRNFRALSSYDAIGAGADFIVTILMIRSGFGPGAILLGTIAGDSSRLIQTWTRFRFQLLPNFEWRHIKSLASFGRWIWGSSVVTLALNQFDKILVARFLGTTEFGLYQVASRISQLALADGATALGQFLYPTFAHKCRRSGEEASRFLLFVLKRVAPVVFVVAMLIGIFSQQILSVVLGPEWLPAAAVLRILALAMALGSVIAVLVSYLRAVGKPQSVTKATLIQLVVLALIAVPLLLEFGALGMAVAAATAGATTVAYLSSRLRAVTDAKPVPVLITTAMRVSSMQTQLSDVSDRLEAVIAALDEWARTPGVKELVVCDGSGFDLSQVSRDLMRKYPSLHVEALSFENDAESVRVKGKGYGEGEIINYALTHSALLARADAFAKCTGKLWVSNYADCLRAFTGNVSFDYNGRFHPRFLDTRFYLVSKDFFRSVLSSSFKNVDDDSGFFLEHAYLEALHSHRVSSYVMCPTPRIKGISGSLGTPFKVNAVKARARDLRSALVRAVGL